MSQVGIDVLFFSIFGCNYKIIKKVMLHNSSDIIVNIRVKSKLMITR